MMENTFSSDVKVLVAVEYIVLFNEAAHNILLHAMKITILLILYF